MAAETVEDELVRAAEAALARLAALGVEDPLVALAAGDLCAEALAAFVARCRGGRVRVADSLRMEATRLLEPLARERPDGLRALVVASAGAAAWRQANDCAQAALVAGEADGAVVCGVRDGRACAVALHGPLATPAGEDA